MAQEFISWNNKKPSIAMQSIGMLFLFFFLLGIQETFASEAVTSHGPDMITGATPHAKGTPRVKKTCWKRADCTSCHGDAHLSGFKSANCSFCHGPIGAKKRPLTLESGNDHPDKSCTNCHRDVHVDLQFESPEDCRACHRYERKGPGCSRTEDYDVVVIGAGGGGLAAATMLASQGLSVVVLEQHFRTGGMMNNFQRFDYRFETSLHAFPGNGFSYLNTLGIADEITPVYDDVMYRTIYPDFTLDIPQDVNDYQELLKNQFPAYASNIDALFQGFNSFDMATYGDMTLLEAMDYHGIDDEKLIAVFNLIVHFLAQGGIDVVPVRNFLGAWYSFHHFGYYYIEGGSQAITDAMEKAIVEASGTIKRNAKVSRIFVENNQVTGAKTTDGVCYSSRYVVSNANAKSTFLGMIGEKYLPEEMIDELHARRPAISPAAVLFLGVDTDYTNYFPENTHTVFTMNNYAMLDDDLEKLFCLPEQVTLIVQNYTMADPETAPPGKNVIVVLAHLMNYECNDYWNWTYSYKKYQHYKRKLADVIIDRLEELLPDVSEHIEVMEMASPQTVKHFTLNPRGSWAGWAYEPDAEFEYTGRIETPISGLYMAGAWARDTAGQSGVIISGIDAANLILSNEP